MNKCPKCRNAYSMINECLLPHNQEYLKKQYQAYCEDRNCGFYLKAGDRKDPYAKVTQKEIDNYYANKEAE